MEGYRAPDPVFDQTRYLLEVLACEALAAQAIDQGKQAYALQLLEQADAAAGKTIYAPDDSRRTVLRWQADPRTARSARLPLTEGLLVYADGALQQEDFARAVALLDAAPERSARWYLLRGTAALHLEDGEAAVQYLRQAEYAYPRQCIPLLEQAYLLVGDYKHAYEYAKRNTQGN